MWGGTPHRNMVSAEKNPPTEWDVGDKDDPPTTRTSSGKPSLGSKSYGNPVIANGMVFVGTNNEAQVRPEVHHRRRRAIDGGVLMASTRRPASSSGNTTTPSSPPAA